VETPIQKEGHKLAPVGMGKLKQKLHLAGQQKYSIDANRSAWDQFLFWYVFLPFNRFFFDRFRFQPPDAKDANGNLSSLEIQGAYTSAWEAEQEAAKHPFGVVLKDIYLGESLPAASFRPSQVHPNSTSKIYERIGHETVSVPSRDMDRLEQKLQDTEAIVSHFRELKIV